MRSLALCLVLVPCLPPVGSRGTIIKVCVLFVHIIVEVRVRDTDRGLKMFYDLFSHYYDNIGVMLIL